MAGISPAVAASIIDLLGGQTDVARALNLRQSSVWDWTRKANLSSRRIDQLIQLGARRGVDLEPNHFFGLLPLPSKKEAA